MMIHIYVVHVKSTLGLVNCSCYIVILEVQWFGVPHVVMEYMIIVSQILLIMLIDNVVVMLNSEEKRE